MARALGNNKEFRATVEAYFQNTGKRVNHAQIGNVPTGPARLNIAACSNGFDAVMRLSLLYVFPSGVTSH